MTWDAHRGVLDRELAAINAGPFLEVATPVFVESINYATNALVRCNTDAQGADGEDAAPLALFHHIIVMADGVEVLVEASSASACVPLVRSAFEAWLALQWMLQKQETYRARALAWIVGDMRRRVRDLEQLDTGNPHGVDLRTDIEHDQFARTVQVPPAEALRQEIEKGREGLRVPVLADTLAEFARAKAKLKREPAWFELYDGPRTLRGLARSLDMGAVYAVLYRAWSTTAHAGDAVRYAVAGPNGGGVIGQVRAPAELPSVTSTTAAFLNDATRRMLAKFRPGEEECYGRWYVECVQARMGAARKIVFGPPQVAPGGRIIQRR